MKTILNKITESKENKIQFILLVTFIVLLIFMLSSNYVIKDFKYNSF